MSPRLDERGLASPVLVTLAGVLVVATVLAAALGRLLIDQRRVAAAADLAGLAAAAAIQHGRAPCLAARATAKDNGARLIGCAVHGHRVRVESGLASPTVFGQVVRLRATAYAGPVE